MLLIHGSHGAMEATKRKDLPLDLKSLFHKDPADTRTEITLDFDDAVLHRPASPTRTFDPDHQFFNIQKVMGKTANNGNDFSVPPAFFDLEVNGFHGR
jgi:hypothetical protein